MILTFNPGADDLSAKSLIIPTAFVTLSVLVTALIVTSSELPSSCRAAAGSLNRVRSIFFYLANTIYNEHHIQKYPTLSTIRTNCSPKLWKYETETVYVCKSYTWDNVIYTLCRRKANIECTYTSIYEQKKGNNETLFSLPTNNNQQ